MGGTKWLNAGKVGNEYETIAEVDGIQIVKHKISGSSSTPTYSNNSKYYATYDSTTGKIKQITCYDEETSAKIYDIDWGHKHGEFKKGEPHVQYYKNGIRQKETYEPNSEQYALYLKLKDIEGGYIKK